MHVGKYKTGNSETDYISPQSWDVGVKQLREDRSYEYNVGIQGCRHVRHWYFTWRIRKMLAELDPHVINHKVIHSNTPPQTTESPSYITKSLTFVEDRALVSVLVTMSSVKLYTRQTDLHSIIQWIKWKSSSICFFLTWYWRSLVSTTVNWLLENMWWG